MGVDPPQHQSPLAWVCVGTNTSRGRSGSAFSVRPKVASIPNTTAYAASTPKLTEAITVKQRTTGIINEVTTGHLVADI